MSMQLGTLLPVDRVDEKRKVGAIVLSHVAINGAHIAAASIVETGDVDR